MYFAVDVGGSSIKYGLINEKNMLIAKGTASSTFGSSEEFAAGIRKLYDEFGAKADAVAVSYCGDLDPENGYAYSGGSLIYNTGVELRTLLRKHLPVPVSVENDANCAALAEIGYGCLKDVKNAIVLVLGSGLGASIVINGELYRGSHFTAGGASYMMPNLREPLNPGSTLVQFLYGQNIEGYDPGNTVMMELGYMSLTLPMALKKGWKTEETNGKRFFEALAAGDEDANEILDRYCASLAAFIYNMQCMMDMDVFAIGGGISRQPVLIERTKAFLDKNYATLRAMGLSMTPPVVRTCELSSDANLYGAVYHYKLQNKLV